MKREITEMRLSSEKLGNLNFPAIGESQRIKKPKKKKKNYNIMFHSYIRKID
jgi:hypothetical protein